MSDYSTRIFEAAKNAIKKVYDIDIDEKLLIVEIPKNPKMGDYSTSVAMRLAKALGVTIEQLVGEDPPNTNA